MALTPILDASANEPAPSVRGITHPPAVQAVAAVSGSASAASGTTADTGQDAQQHQQAAGAADYARAFARISDILTDLSAQRPQVTNRAKAEARVVALMPEPVVVIPMFPASADQVQRAVETAQELAERASQALAAQANVNGGMVEQILSARS